MSELTQIAGIPVLAGHGVMHPERPVVIVIHGMSTTAETLRDGFPEADDGLARVYWRLPILRDGRDAVGARRQRDLFRDLFAPVVAESRAELGRLVAAFAPRPVGLFGFSIGALISLWGAADQSAVRAAVAAAGVPSLEYLIDFFPDYDWLQPDVLAERRRHDLGLSLDRLAGKATLILHGDLDDTARFTLIADVAERLGRTGRGRHLVQRFPHVRHRLVADGPEEEADLARLRAAATAFLQAELRA
jgi:dienelactone hydrolase